MAVESLPMMQSSPVLADGEQTEVSKASSHASSNAIPSAYNKDPVENVKATPTVHRPQKRKSRSKAAASSLVKIRILLISGNRAEFTFKPSDTIGDIRQHIFVNWPQEWKMDPVPMSVECLKLLHYGRFLNDCETLKGLNLPTKEISTLHLIIKLHAPSEYSSKGKFSGRFCGFRCSIM